MNAKFDELAKNMAQSVTRRGALKKFGIGIVGMAMASLGLANKAEANPPKPIHCRCRRTDFGCDPQSLNYYQCTQICAPQCTG